MNDPTHILKSLEPTRSLAFPIVPDKTKLNNFTLLLFIVNLLIYEVDEIIFKCFVAGHSLMASDSALRLDTTVVIVRSVLSIQPNNPLPQGATIVLSTQSNAVTVPAGQAGQGTTLTPGISKPATHTRLSSCAGSVTNGLP